MSEIHVRQLSDAEQQRILNAGELAERQNLLDSVDSIDVRATELRAIQIADTEKSGQDLSESLDVLAVALGFHIQQATGMQWASVTDGHQSTLVLIGVHGENTVVVYPFDVVERRWHNTDPDLFRSYVDEVLRSITESRTVVESPESD
ncbi:DUF3806 domain-containing protein [Arcanobacterium buesumense]|uniref:DUF3806 domain-containing protein n=1 Tax=Arcanobacterium buesumense TaxID=2722751 RepID=A0A6H2EI13_9ACTO|nr:DUF3806 domain-containing protein [Arcanobacterium buesumense]QJC21205.1 DUF3806 domain-containing protein [Arcanobacterium buesumense]